VGVARYRGGLHRAEPHLRTGGLASTRQFTVSGCISITTVCAISEAGVADWASVGLRSSRPRGAPQHTNSA